MILWGLLTHRHFHFPDTGSLDFDNYISSIVEFLGQPCCSNFDKECLEPIRFVNEQGGFVVNNGNEILTHKYSQIQKTNLLKRMEKLAKRGKILELHEIIVSTRSTITNIAEMVEDFPNLDDKTKFEIDQLRFSIGLDIEHYLVEYLRLKGYPYLDDFLAHAETIEWVNPWLV